MIKIITETLIDAFCASMLGGFFSLGIAFFLVPIIEPYIAIWTSVLSLPLFVVGLVFFMLLDRTRS